MNNFLFARQWGWKMSGVMLALSFLLAVFLVKPIGVSTQFVILDGVIWDAVSPEVVVESTNNKSGYASGNAYLNKSGGKYAKSVANPWNYSFIFVLAMLVGGVLGRLMNVSKTKDYENEDELIAIRRFDDLSAKRVALVFVGGVLVLFGARLAGGCTSGHMMSGMMQTSLSGYLFAVGAFAAAIPTAILVYGRGD